MVAERSTCFAAATTSLERSRSTRACFSPSSSSKVIGDGQHEVVDPSALVAGKWSPLRRRSQSQNQIYRALGYDTSLRDSKARVAVAPLRLKNLPLSAFSDSHLCSKPTAAALRSPKTSVHIQLAPLKRVSSPQPERDADGNQDESSDGDEEEEEGTSSARTTDCSSSSNDNQFDHRDTVALRDSVKLVDSRNNGRASADSDERVESPEASGPRPTFLPRLATLDLTGDSRYLLRHSSSSSVSPSKRHWSRVERICDEIVSTERSYVRDLRILLRHFFAPLQEYAIKYTVPLGAISALHASIRTIVHIHKELLRQLASCSSSLSTAFDFTIEFMKVYAFYCSSYLSAKDELALLQRNFPGLNALTTQLDEQARRELRVDIVSLLIKPVQRICRYPLLFRELRKHATSSEQAEIIEATLRKIERVSAHVNEKVREAQNNARLYELHQTIDPKAKIDLLQPSRTLLSEMLVRVVSLDSPCWPSFLLTLGRKRPWRSGDACEVSARRDSTLEAASTPLLSPQSPHSSGFSSISAVSSLTSMRPPLLRRKSSGEKIRLILLSDVLLMAKKQEEKLKIKRQLCLSCAHVTDSTGNATDSAATTATRQQQQPPWSFTMEVAKVGRCNCHQLTPVTLKRSPKRRNSLSLSIPTDLLGSRQSKQSPHSTSTTAKQHHHQQQKASGFFRGSEFASAFRSAKRYVVICESEQKKSEFVVILQSAITRCARVQPARSSFPSVCDAAKLPGRFWRSLKPQQQNHGLEHQPRPEPMQEPILPANSALERSALERNTEHEASTTTLSAAKAESKPYSARVGLASV